MNTDFLDELNESQRKAVETTEGYIRLTAGAGSGTRPRKPGLPGTARPLLHRGCDLSC